MENRKKKDVKLTCIDKDKDVYVYEVDYKGKLFMLQFYLRVNKSVLYMDGVDIEGTGPNIFGNKFITVIKEVAEEFCKEYETSSIEIKGNKRGAGKTRGKFLNTIKLNFK
jgi:hypothetical protein